MGMININIIADDRDDAEIAARLVAATFNSNGFEDVTNNSHPTHIDREEEVVEAMRNLNPSIFQSEVVIDVLDSTDVEAGIAAGSDDDDADEREDDDD